MRSVVVLAFALTLAACGQEIVTVECDSDAHVADPDAGITPNADATTNLDATQETPDTGVQPADTGVPPQPDAGTPEQDAGMTGCGASPYCITALTASKPFANVREPITFTPTIDNPGAVALTFTAPIGQLVAERRVGLPPLVMNDVMLNYVVDANGAITFTVQDVPSFFAATTFVVKLHAKGPGSMPEVTTEARVNIRGNTVFSNYQTVQAVASDGRPARGTSLAAGKLIEGSSFVREPGNMLMARDGTLIVYDTGASPERLRRFELSGENVHLGDFAYQNANSEPYISLDQSGTGLTQLMDGRFALAIYDYDQTPDSSIVLWNEDGSYDRTIQALDPNKRWQSISASKTANEILVVEASGSGRLFRIDPANGTELGTIATDISSAWGLLAVAGGNTYVGITGGLLRVTPQGGKTMISMLMGSSVDYWNFLTLYSEGKVIAARDVSSDYSNIVVINGTVAEGWLRPMMAGGVTSTPQGTAYLE